MARPTNRAVSRITNFGLSTSQMKGAMTTAVLGTIAASVTSKMIGQIQARKDARATAKAFKEQAEKSLDNES